MVILSDNEIKRYIEKGKIGISPYEESNVQGASVDFRLGRGFLVPPNYYGDFAKEEGIVISLDSKVKYEEVDDSEIILPPGHFILGTTLEKLTIPDFLCGEVGGKSGVARKALNIENAGHLGPGFEGQITLELYNGLAFPIKLKEGDGICQVQFHELSSAATKIYRGKFQNQEGPKAN
ncbi:MAG: dCTP deaminase [Candidatus Pacearchaeota archaeon]